MQKEIESTLYDILEIDRKASKEEIKAAYRKLALKFHPDRNNGADAKEAFQKIGLAYEILSNGEKKERYDKTGSWEQEIATRDWDEYFRALYEKVSMGSIEEFKASYVGSAEEHEDILASYIKHRGNILQIIDDIFFATTKDIPRIEETISRAVSKRIVPKSKGFEKGVSKKDLAKKRKFEEREEEESKELTEDLVKTIQSRRSQSMEKIISSLEEKYSQPAQKRQKTRKRK